MIAPVLVKQPWRIGVKVIGITRYEINHFISTINQSTTKQCAYLMGYTRKDGDDWCSFQCRGHALGMESQEFLICCLILALLWLLNPKIRLSVRSRKVSKPRDLYLELSDRYEIWQALRQQCCRCACQISKRYDNLKYQSRGFEPSRDLTKRRLFGYWDGAQVPCCFRNQIISRQNSDLLLFLINSLGKSVILEMSFSFFCNS